MLGQDLLPHAETTLHALHTARKEDTRAHLISTASMQ